MISRIRKYFSTHFTASFLLCLWVLFSVILFFQEQYLGRGYFNYLLNASYEEAEAAIRYMQDDLNKALRDLVVQQSTVATDETLYQYACKAADRENPSHLYDQLSLQTRLRYVDNLGDSVAYAVVTESGLLAQYDRLKKSNLTQALWSGENTAVLEKMGAHILDKPDEPHPGLPRIWVWMEPAEHPGGESGPVFHVMLPLTGGAVSSWNTKFGLVSTYSARPLQQILSYVNERQQEYFSIYLTNGAGQPVLDDGSGTSAEILEEGGTEENEQVLKMAQPLAYFGWTLNVRIDEENMLHMVHRLFLRSAVIVQGVLLLAVLALFFVFERMMRPVALLSDSMRQAEQGNLHTKIPIRGRHEIWQVAEEYNRMIENLEEKNREIQRQHQETLRSIKQQHAAEWEALESQINAHFICNTVGCISYEAIEAGNHEVSLLLKKLSNILRYTFDQKRQEVMLYQEIAWLDQYLYLQKMRREDLFDYEISFPEVYGQWPCCKLMFQPFVENSIIHGFEGRKTGGMIRVTAVMMDERLKITIEDNGCGMPEEKAEELRQVLSRSGETAPETGERVGVGVRNAITRMRMFYGDRFEAELQTEEGGGTSFIFVLPIPQRQMTDEAQELEPQDPEPPESAPQNTVPLEPAHRNTEPRGPETRKNTNLEE